MTDHDDLWAGFYDDQDPAQLNPFTPGTEEHAAFERQVTAERAQYAAKREAARADRERRDLETETARQLLLKRARTAADEIFANERAGQIIIPPAITLTDLLNQPIEPTRYRVDQLWPRRGNVMLSAQYKAGKTTARDNLVRSLVDGEPFLGVYDVEPIEGGRVGVIDSEMAENKLQEWLRDQAIRNTDDVILWALRGRVRAFDILNEAVRRHWVELIKSAQVRIMVLDVLGPFLGALNLDENSNPDVIRFFEAFDATMADAGVEETVVVHHMGHAAERSRGASRLRDWPDAEWRLVRQKDEDNPYGDADPAAPRFFSAFGRDVDVREGQITFDAATRRLFYVDINRKQARAAAAQQFVLGYVKVHPSATVRAIQDASATVEGITRDSVREAVKQAIRDRYLAVADGPNRSQLHTLTQHGYGALAGGL
jgi:hypothetical protein